MAENQIQFIMLIIITIIALFFLFNNLNEPPKYSIDSLRNANCNDLHSTYSDCIRKSNSMYWDYCNTLILPFYYNKCI